MTIRMEPIDWRVFQYLKISATSTKPIIIYPHNNHMSGSSAGVGGKFKWFTKKFTSASKPTAANANININPTGAVTTANFNAAANVTANTVDSVEEYNGHISFSLAGPQLTEPPVVQLTRDMFGAKHEKVHRQELQPFILNATLYALSKLPQFRVLSENPTGDLLNSVVAGLMYQTISSMVMNGGAISDDDYYDARFIVDLIATQLNPLMESCLREKNRYISQAKCYTGAAVHMSVAGKRITNEDRHVAFPFLNEMLEIKKPNHSLAFYGVFDGHGGAECANFVATRLHLNIANNPVLDSDPKRAILEGYIQTHQQWKWSSPGCGYSNSTGSTAVTVLVQDRSLFIAWAGDSSAMIFMKNGTCLDFVTPHKPQFEMEKKRIMKLGGFVKNDRVNGILAVSRSFGDTQYGCVNPEPNIMEYTLRGDERFLLLACDGLTDVMSPTQILEVINSVIGDPTNEKKINAVSQALINKALERETADNVSVVFVPLDVPHRFKDPENHQFTDLLDLCTKSLAKAPYESNVNASSAGVTSLVEDFSKTGPGKVRVEQPYPTVESTREEIEDMVRAMSVPDENLGDDKFANDLAAKIRQKLETSNQTAAIDGGESSITAVSVDDADFAADCPTPTIPESEIQTLLPDSQESPIVIVQESELAAATGTAEKDSACQAATNVSETAPPSLSIISNRDMLDAMATTNSSNYTWKQLSPSPNSPGFASLAAVTTGSSSAATGALPAPSSYLPRGQLSPLMENLPYALPSLVATRSPKAATTSNSSPPTGSPAGTRKSDPTDGNTNAILELRALLEINRQLGASSGSLSPSNTGTPYSTQAIQELRNQFRLTTTSD